MRGDFHGTLHAHLVGAAVEAAAMGDRKDGAYQTTMLLRHDDADAWTPPPLGLRGPESLKLPSEVGWYDFSEVTKFDLYRAVSSIFTIKKILIRGP
jgi:hypothetical protein